MPAVLVEVGFINSDVDNKLFDENFEEIAQAIAYGILDTLESNHEVESPGYEVQVHTETKDMHRTCWKNC